MAQMVPGNKSVVASPKSSPHTKGKGSIPSKMRVHPHTSKALNAVAVKMAIRNKSGAGTDNGLTGADDRY